MNGYFLNAEHVNNLLKCHITTHRRGIALACLGGPIYAVGGLDDSSCFRTVERYDSESEKWNFVAEMNTARGGVGVATLKVCLQIEIQLCSF